MELAPPSCRCRLCGSSAHQRRVGREARARLGQWLVRCGYCAAVYLDPDLAPAAQAEFYARHYRRLFPYEACSRPGEAFLLARRSREIGHRRARLLSAGIPAGGRALEIGSGDGAFLGRLHHLRPDLELQAVEPDQRCRQLALDGAPVRFNDADALPAASQFDLIVLFHTLEHVVNPTAELRRLGGMLTPNGRIVIEVPDAIASWAEVHPAHLTVFTAQSLERTVRRAGLAPLPTDNAAPPGTIWVEAGKAAHPEPPEAAGQSEITTLDAALDTAHARQQSPLRRLAMAAARTGLGMERLGALSRWRQAPALDDSLAEPSGRRFRLGTGLDLLTMDAVVERAVQAMAERQPIRVADVNVAKLIAMRDSSEFRMAVLGADIITADGMGVVWAARLLGLNLPERVSGVDLLDRIAAACARNGFRPYVVGARADVLERGVAELVRRHPGLSPAGWHHGYFAPSEEPHIIEAIRRSDADCLVAAMPSPRQDLFLARNWQAAGVRFAMGVGGSMDVLAGDLKRAPVWMRRSGTEWLFRMLQEPLRLGPRYVSANSRFGALLLSEWIARKSLRRAIASDDFGKN